MNGSGQAGTAEGVLLELSARGHRVPIGTHLVLHGHADHAAIVADGRRLGDVLVETAERFATPLAVPLMDLTIEKEGLLTGMGVAREEVESYHFAGVPGESAGFAATARTEAACGAIARVAEHGAGLLPMGMGIGPFSLMTKLVADPITPVYMAGTGMGADDDPEVAVVERALAIGLEWILGYLEAQCDAGAKAFILCEPAANQVYFSPNQLERDHAVFDRYVMEPLRQIKELLDSRGVGLVFHDCGELTEGMVERFGSLAPAMVSLGSSRCLWQDAAKFPATTVVYGNLPTKRFFSSQLTVAEVERTALELLEKMRSTGHPFILGSECDVLSVPGQEEEIRRKVEAFLKCQ